MKAIEELGYEALVDIITEALGDPGLRPKLTFIELANAVRYKNLLGFEEDKTLPNAVQANDCCIFVTDFEIHAVLSSMIAMNMVVVGAYAGGAVYSNLKY